MDMKSRREKCQSEEAALRVRCLTQGYFGSALKNAPVSFLLPAHFPLFGTLKRVLHQAPMTPNLPLKCLFHMWHQKISCVSSAQECTFAAFVLCYSQRWWPPQARSYQHATVSSKRNLYPARMQLQMYIQNSRPSPTNTCKNARMRIRVNKWQRRWQGC